jgi:hypothetical protein
MGILAQVAERDCLAGGCQCSIGACRLQLEVAQPDQGVEGEAFQALPLAVEPIDPSLLRDTDVVEEAALVEPDSLGERGAIAFADQRLELDHIAVDCTSSKANLVAVTDKSILAQHLPQPEQGLAQVLPRLGLEMRAPQQGCELLPRLGCRPSAS